MVGQVSEMKLELEEAFVIKQNHLAHIQVFVTDMTKLDSLVGRFLHSSGETEKNLSNILITMWSNFAKSGSVHKLIFYISSYIQ